MAVLFFAFHTHEHILPNWLAWAAPWCLCKPDRTGWNESSAGRIYRQVSTKETDQTRKARTSIRFQRGVKMEELSQKTLSEADTAKLIFFENLFYKLDSDSNGNINIEDAACMLSFVHLGLPRYMLEDVLSAAWSPKRTFDCRDFVEICVELMWSTPFQEIKLGSDNYISSTNRDQKRRHYYWLTWSKAVDQWSRFWLPLLYTTTLGFLINMDLTDEYESNPMAEMFQGPGPVSMETVGLIQAMITPFVGIISLVTWFYMRRRSMMWKKRQRQEMKAAELEQEMRRSQSTRVRRTVNSEDLAGGKSRSSKTADTDDEGYDTRVVTEHFTGDCKKALDNITL